MIYLLPLLNELCTGKLDRVLYQLLCILERDGGVPHLNRPTVPVLVHHSQLEGYILKNVLIYSECLSCNHYLHFLPLDIRDEGLAVEGVVCVPDSLSPGAGGLLLSDLLSLRTVTLTHGSQCAP